MLGYVTIQYHQHHNRNNEVAKLWKNDEKKKTNGAIEE